jgi:hypothetical protein
VVFLNSLLTPFGRKFKEEKMVMKKIFLPVFVALSSITVFGQTKVNNQTAEQKLNEQYCTGLFKSTQGTILDLENNPAAGAYSNILDWLESRVAGLKVYKKRSGVRIPYIRNQVANIFVDEQQVSASYLNSFPASDIAMIKVIRSPFFGGSNAGTGAIAIYTFGAELNDESKEGK